jgi:16S rRNA (cytosine967-C5)-methyltransferase
MIYTPILKAVRFILIQVFFEGKDSSNELQTYFKAHKELGSKDRKIIASIVYFVVRWWCKLQYAVGNTKETYSEDSIDVILSLTVKLLNYELKKSDDLPFCEQIWIETYHSEELPPNITFAVPQWLYSKVEKECEKNTHDIFKSLNNEARVSVRLNKIKATHELLQQKLKEEEIAFQKSTITPDGYIIDRRPSLIQHELYKSGMIEFQDEASQQMLVLAKPDSGSWVLDVCAGKGGKAIHAASLMENKGIIIASDIEMNRLKELERRAERAGASIIQYDNPERLYKYRDSIDMVIIDAPCSGLGTLMRKPDIKWKLTLSDIEQYIETQKSILEENCLLVKRGGKLVYATCSILPSEGEEQIKSFMEAHQNFELILEQRYHPHIHGTDGFYVAVMRRNS